MPPTELIAQHTAAIDGLAGLADRDLVGLWRTLDPANAAATTARLATDVPDIVTVYGDLAATIAADYYDESRSVAGLGGSFRATPAEVIAPEDAAKTVRWALDPLWIDAQDNNDALARLRAGMERLIRNADRDTIRSAAESDPGASVGYMRRARGTACSFCLMLASRGAVYRSRRTATYSDAGKHYHDHCRCRVDPVFGPSDIPPDVRQLQSEWRSVTAGARDKAAAWDAHIAAKRSQ